MLKKVIKCVKQASKIMLKGDFETKVKTDVTNIVTSADIAIGEFLKKRLARIMPQAGFYGEEEEKQIVKEYFWLVDPIDGTTNFSRGINQAVISVALVHNGEVELGVVYNPFCDDLYYAEKGKGAFNNGKRIHVSNRDFANGLLCAGWAVYKKSITKYCNKIIMEVYPKCNDVRRIGACALELCYIASGKCEMYFEARICPWDYAGASLILKEAGGVIACYDMDKLSFTQTVTLIGANNQENFDKLYKIVEKHLPKDLDLE